MSRHHDTAASDALQEIESFGERVAGWIGANPVPVLVGVALILLSAAFYAGYSAWSSGREDRASAALAEAQAEYQSAMGALPGAAISEPANPETALSARRAAVDRYNEIARRHAGTQAAVHARIEAGSRLLELGDREAAIETWRGVLGETGRQSALRGLLLLRLAQADEAAGRLREAGEQLEQAGSLEDFPLRAWALAEAARAFALAGDAQRAQTLAVRVGTEPGAASLPPALLSEIGELRAASGAPPPPAAMPPDAIQIEAAGSEAPQPAPGP